MKTKGKGFSLIHRMNLPLRLLMVVMMAVTTCSSVLPPVSAAALDEGEPPEPQAEITEEAAEEPPLPEPDEGSTPEPEDGPALPPDALFSLQGEGEFETADASGWTAYNDCAGTNSIANTTSITIGSTTTGTAGTLKNFETGANTSVTAQFTASRTLSTMTTSGAAANSGTDAYNTFNTKANMVGLIQYNTGDTTSDWWLDLTLSGLDPNKTYTFAASANRNDSNYTTRITRFTLSGDEGATNASSSGVTIINDHAVAFSTGYNTLNGYVARWTGIQPGSDGTIVIRSQPESTSEVRVYGPAVFMLQEEASTEPTISTSGTLDAFYTQPGVYSAEQSYSVSGSNLTEDLVIISAPENFEVSTTSGGSFFDNLSLTPTDGTLAETTIYVRFRSNTEGTTTGSITHTSAGAEPVVIPVSGTASDAPPCTDVSLEVVADTHMRSGSTRGSYNYGGSAEVRVNPFYQGGSTDGQLTGALLRWDVSSIPAGATVSAASLTFNVTDGSNYAYSLYNLRRAWVEGSNDGATGTGASWNYYDAGSNNWGTEGAQNTSSDRYDTNLWSASASDFNQTGSVTMALNSAGVDVVQGWVDGTANYGLTIQNYSGSTVDVWKAVSRNASPSGQGAKLNITYCLGGGTTYTLTAGNDGHGSVTLNPSGGVYSAGSSVTLAPVANPGYIFSYWSGANAGELTDNGNGSWSITMNADKTVKANFSASTGGWTAYNDCAWASGQTETNITRYTISSSVGDGLSGVLKKYSDGSNTPVTVAFTSYNSPSVQTGSSYGGAETEAGTDAYTTFHGFVDMPGVIQYGSSGWWVDMTFTGLDPAKTYTLATSANRANSDYTGRIAKFTISDVDAATNASTTGVTVSQTTLPGDTIAFSTGYNTVNGYVARWTGIQPGSDGTFKVRSEAGPDEYRAYGPSVFMLQEEGSTQPNQAPDQPLLVQPADNAQDIGLTPTLEVTVSDPDADPMDVDFYVREAGLSGGGEDFMLVAIPDTQNLATSYPTIFNQTIQWIVDNRAANNIVFATHLGDLVNTATSTTEWDRASAAMALMDNAVPRVPYSVGPGNHDLGGSYNGYFGPSRFVGNGHYQDSYALNQNENNYSFLTAGGMDFIIINLQYNSTSAHQEWADGLLKANPNRRGIVVQHNILNTDNSWNNQALFTGLKDNPNLFLMLCGHMHTPTDGAAYRAELGDDGHTIHIMLADYQDFTGKGYLRLLRFSPQNDTIYATTYSPTVPEYITSTTNYDQVDLAYAMDGGSSAPFVLKGTIQGVDSGQNAQLPISGLVNDTTYEWYVDVSDGELTTTSPIWSFTTEGVAVNNPPVITESDPVAVSMSEDGVPTAFALTLHATDLDGDTLTWSIKTQASHGTASASGTGNSKDIGYIPLEHYFGTDSFVVQVVDGKGGEDSITVNVTIEAVNDAPVLAPIGNKAVDELVALLFTATATDVENDPLTFSLVGAPEGATITAGGAFSWTPTEAQGPDVYNFTVKVCDDGTPSLCGQEAIAVTVNEVNLAPVLDEIGSQSVKETETLSFTATATDADLPANTLAFSLENAPAGAGITSGGLFSWTPTEDQGPADYDITFKVCDNGSPVLCDSEVVRVSVTEGGGVPTLPHSFHGAIQINDNPPSAGDLVEAFVEGAADRVAFAPITADPLYYSITVPADDDGTPQKEGGLEGDEITFKINGRVVAKGTWHSGGNTFMNFHPPQALPGGPYSGQIGTAIQFNATANDNGGDVTSYAWDWDNDGTYDAVGPNPTHSWPAAGEYEVSLKVTDAQGGEGTATTTVNVTDIPVEITITNLNHSYDGTAKAATVTTNPSVAHTVTYDGSATPPTNAGSYTVQVTITETGYSGSKSDTLIIAKADTATTVSGGGSFIYNGSARAATVSVTGPGGLSLAPEPVYSGNCSAAPVNVADTPCTASYTYAGDDNYNGSSDSAQIIITKADTVTIVSGGGSFIYNGSARAATVSVTGPGGLSLAPEPVYSGNCSAAPVNVADTPCTASYTYTESANHNGSSDSAVITISKASAQVTLSGLSQVYDGDPKPVSVTTDPENLNVVVTYDGEPTAPTDVGSYAVLATVVEANYAGSASDTLVIAQSQADIQIGSLAHVYDGTAKQASVTTDPAGLAYSITYNGSAALPINAGSYTVLVTITEPGYAGTKSATMVISKAAATVVLGSLSQVYDGSPKAASATTTPAGLSVSFTYDGSATPPTDPGSYAVVGTINDINYEGSAEGTLVILAKHSLALEAGWNLVSFAVDPLSTAIEDVLASIAGKFDLVYAWDASGASSGSGNWLKYDNIPASLDNLTDLDASMGFWIHMTTAGVLEVVGTLPTETSIAIYDNVGGWNLVGYPSASDGDLPDILSDHGLGSNFSLVFSYRASDTADPWKIFDRTGQPYANDLTQLKAGWGYWIKVSADSTWSVEY